MALVEGTEGNAIGTLSINERERVFPLPPLSSPLHPSHAPEEEETLVEVVAAELRGKDSLEGVLQEEEGGEKDPVGQPGGVVRLVGCLDGS